MGTRIDFNCDLGEGCGNDAAILPHVTSASIACGGHAGDETTMRQTLRLCREHGVAAGAHPSYEDREHFGRRILDVAPADVARMVRDQVARLRAIAREEGVALAHVKPHGALYNVAADDRAVADAIAATVADFDPALALYALSGSALAQAGIEHGLRVAHEVFAERGYDTRGRLRPRGTPGAVIESLDASIVQVRRLVAHGEVLADDGSVVHLRADTLCLHGDRPDAVAFARAVREALEAGGIAVRPFGAAA
ncbi:LamB/YcsF family protein [Lysobacter auxotrophicus]|uniref:LamB/YcsF family protein n=1 Tax=Lysobacter auxotrophicus TaxID=2992573 RepID=A0ABN6UJ43_9GAMM|nr:5-oxoprolinase subunit PxpA [Lysobacter auxotrophicus]BDU16125.1 LamB/YcsF family protein [Lysobacter auxotrophicus]